MYVYVWTVMSNPYLRPQKLKNRKDDVISYTESPVGKETELSSV